MADLLTGTKIFKLHGGKFEEVDGAANLKGKVVGLYFSAHWCGPCRGFTPTLRKFYDALKKEHANFEIVFVSWDENEEAMLSYFKESHGDWCALELSDPKVQELQEKFNVDGIPTLVVLDADGHVVDEDGRSKVDDHVDNPQEAFKQWRK